VNADDFGRSPGVNRGIARAHEDGIVTSASLMVRGSAAADAAVYARSHPELSVGLHVDLGEWVYEAGAWQAGKDVRRVADSASVEDEVADQLSAFRNLTGRDPTHVDSHQHVHRDEPVRSVLIRFARELAVPLREFSPDVQYVGRFFGQTSNGSPYPEGIRVEALLAILASLPPGATELGCHPGYANGLDSSYRDERERELEALCDPRVRAAIAQEGIELCSFVDLV
jgi:chitin disaccharide deacetylase